MTDNRLKISPPWITYINKLQAMFDGDPEIAFNIDYSNLKVVLATNNSEKAAALLLLLPQQKLFGNIILTIDVDCAKISNRAFVTAKELFEVAFSKNPALSRVVVPENTWYVPFTYVMFTKCVVQFFNDQLDSPYGIMSVLLQDIAEEIFADMKYPRIGVSFSTDVEDAYARSVCKAESV